MKKLAFIALSLAAAAFAHAASVFAHQPRAGLSRVLLGLWLACAARSREEAGREFAFIEDTATA